MGFEVVGKTANVQTIAIGGRIREVARLRRAYGPGRWKKRKGVAWIRLPDGTLCGAEIHWCEAHGVGRREPTGCWKTRSCVDCSNPPEANKKVQMQGGASR